MRSWRNLAVGAALALSAPVAGQLTVPSLPLPPVSRVVEGVTRPIGHAVGPVLTDARDLVRARIKRLDELVRRNRGVIERDLSGQPARRGELLLLDASPNELAVASQAGFTVQERATIEELGFAVVRVATPSGLSLAAAESKLEGLLPGASVSADLLHFQAGGDALAAGDATAGNGAAITTPVGVIDGASGAAIVPRATRGFARGAPLPSNHGSAIVSLLAAAGVRHVLVADVYGADPAGGNALALARGLGWLVGQGARVVTISLVGPASPVVARSVAAAQARGVLIVAAVGNDGPAAPPAYPAAYPGVLAVTAVDGRNRALLEAGRALHLDYAAPGADMLAADARGRWVKVRGTSYAAPLVAARAAAAWGPRPATITALDREARDLGAPGSDRAFGRGLLCGACRRTR